MFQLISGVVPAARPHLGYILIFLIHCVIISGCLGTDDVRFRESVEDPLPSITFSDGNQPDKEDNETIGSNGREVSEQRYTE